MDRQNTSSRNHADKNFKPHYIRNGYARKYGLNADYFDRYGAYAANPLVAADCETETGVPVPAEINTEIEREFSEEHEI
jgi:hypothetical protein